MKRNASQRQLSDEEKVALGRKLNQVKALLPLGHRWPWLKREALR
ncbi:hypothetical protein C7441_11451 [Pseudaminobacter salicylatoxidans]|uniref:Transposase n=1 Tax=Pseudaminobacter salicylatoxidans TaxID=93369 RepID=A0A316C0J8_PSESE|nr:hypothetical protein C7441_11451 [Pseudaminobacter salicylatoxidans]